MKLKEAFHECPASLSLHEIRTEHACDAMAGDIKYHQSCWRTIIHKRAPEVKIPTKSAPPVCDITPPPPPSPPLPTPLPPPPPPEPDVEFSMGEATYDDELAFDSDVSGPESPPSTEYKPTSRRQRAERSRSNETEYKEDLDNTLNEVVVSEIIRGTIQE